MNKKSFALRALSILFACLLTHTSLSAQTKSHYEIGKGLSVEVGEEHSFEFNGFLCMDAATTKESQESEVESKLGLNTLQMLVGGSSFTKTINWQVQVDLVKTPVLLDAYISYRPIETCDLTIGQQRTTTGTRSMRTSSKQTAFDDRGLVSRTFFGREMGLFASHRNSQVADLGYEINVALTRGEGPNLFGDHTGSGRHVGKLGGRIDLYPLGFFTDENGLSHTDFVREQHPKIGIGVAYNYTTGVSHPTGEGYNAFKLYDERGNEKYPDYQKLTTDVMLKYQGMTLIGEYTLARSARYKGLRPQGGTQELTEREIAEYLMVGSGYNIQAGYLFANNWSVDVALEGLRPLWTDVSGKLMQTHSLTAAISRYVVDNRLKIQMRGNYLQTTQANATNKGWSAQLLVHILL